MTQEEKIKDLEERIALMEADNSALAVDIEHYKKVAAGLKGRNKQLAERIEHYKQLDLEGDGLYEETLAMLEEKEKIIAGLQSQVCRLTVENKKLKVSIEGKERLIEELELATIKLHAPWWKRIFM
jgi:chromosome segregation ATPase